MENQFTIKDVEQERDKVDNYIITANITLIAAFMVIVTIKEVDAKYLNYTYLSSFGGLTLSLLCSLWHKYRFPKRKLALEKESREIVHNVSGELATFLENILIPFKAHKVKEIKSQNPNITPAQIEKAVKKEIEQNAGGTIKTYLEKFQYDLDIKKKEILSKPLDENGAILKHLIDRFTQSFRYIGFVVGILFFFISIFLTLLDK